MEPFQIVADRTLTSAGSDIQTATVSTVSRTVDHVPTDVPINPRYQRYSFAAAPNDIGQPPRDLLVKIAPSTRLAQERFTQALDSRCASYPHLSLGLERPWTAPLFPLKVEPTGKRVVEFMQGCRPLLDQMIADYQTHTQDSQSARDRIVRTWKATIYDSVTASPSNRDAMNALAAELRHGHYDPVILFALLSYRDLSSAIRESCQRSIFRSLQLRPCSKLTQYMLITAMGDHDNCIPADELARLTTMLIEATPDVWNHYAHEPAPRYCLSGSL